MKTWFSIVNNKFIYYIIVSLTLDKLKEHQVSLDSWIMICFWLLNNITQTQAYFSSKFFWIAIIKAFVVSIKKAVLGFGVNIFLTVIYSFLPKSRLLLQNYRNFQLNACSCNKRPHFTASIVARYGIWLRYGPWDLSISDL